MREEHIQLFRLHACVCQGLLRSFTHNLDGKFKDLGAIHMNGVLVISHGFGAGRLTAAACGLEQMLAAVAISTHIDAQHAVALFNLAHYCCTGAIAEEYAGVSILPVHNARQGLRTNNQNFIIQASFYHLASHCQAVHKAAAACCQIKGSCVLSAQASLHEASGGRENVVGGSSSYDDQINFLRGYLGILQSLYSCIVSQIAGCFFRSSNMSLFNTGTFSDPFITGINHFFQIKISQSFFRNIMSHA